MRVLSGKDVVNALNAVYKKRVVELQQQGISPTLAVVRIGQREDDIAYEKGIKKRFENVGASVRITTLDQDVSQRGLVDTIDALNNDSRVHGILLFRPLPSQIDEEAIKVLIAPEKDVDCMGYINMARLFAGNTGAYGTQGFAPCTAKAVMEMLEHYNIDVSGKRVTIVGRSLVVGKPLAMLMLAKNATVTVCHTKTADLAAECKRADILVACAGKARMISAEFVHPDQIVVDVGINMVDGKLCGDVDYEAVSEIVEAITPVPGGVGTVTTSVLLGHVLVKLPKQV